VIRLPFCVTLPDLDEPWQWRQARIDAVHALDQNVTKNVCNTTIDWPALVRQSKGQAEQIVRPEWLPARPPRRPPSAVKIATYWAERRAGVFNVDVDDPACFRCGLSVSEWGRLERAHLVDRWCGGLDHEGNMAMLCCVCHKAMPWYDIDGVDGAIAWIADGLSN
jgi:5-methylcytosine-specific restriction endonuclease McrA